MAGGATYWGRYYRLTIRPPGGDTETFETRGGGPAMDIKFDVTYARGQLAREGTVSILGLGYEKIHRFLSLAAMARGAAMSELAQLSLEVGYSSAAGTIEVLNGFVWYGSVTSPPNMWLTLKVAEYNPLGGITAQVVCDKETPLADFLDYVCDQYNEAENSEGGSGSVHFDWVDWTEDYLVESNEIMVTCQFNETLSLSDCLRKLSKELSDQVQFTLRTHIGESSGGMRIIEVLDKAENKVMDGSVSVDPDHGLLSVSGIDCVSGCVTTFIDGRGDDELCHLVLSSDLNPQADGRYYIYKKQYVGHYLGQEWYTKYYCSGKEGVGDND